MAKYEVCGHHYVDLSEFGFGTSLLSDRKYGFSVHENLIKMSLLRSSKKPDDTADMGDHEFRYGFHPHKGTFAEVNLPRIGYEFNQPLLLTQFSSASSSRSFLKVDAQNVMVEVVKRAEGPLENDINDNGDKHIIIRVWETMGGRGNSKLHVNLPVKSVTRCNLLEHDLKENQPTLSGEGEQKTLQFSFKPFEIISFKFAI